MAKLRVTGKRFSLNGMLGITLIAVLVVAVVSLVAAAVILPKYAEVTDHETPSVVAIVAPDNGLISIGADPSQVFVTVKYSDGSSQQVALSELVVTGLDTSTEGTLDGVVLDYGGFKQTVSFNVVPTELQIEYVASTGGRIDGDAIQSITAGADATRVEAIADEGYYFAGWSDGDVNASRLDKQVSKSMRLIAKFEKLRYTVVFYYPDGTTAREEIVAYNEAPLRVPRPDEHNMEMYGYRFIGWDVDYTHITKDTNIYPMFEKYSADFHIEYTIDGEGNVLGTSDALEYYENDELATVRVKPTGASQDYTFTGWSVYDVDLQAWISLEPEMNGGKLVRVGVNHAIEFLSTRTGTSNEHILSFTPDENVDDIYVKAHFVYNSSTITFTNMNNEARAPLTIDYKTPIGNLFDVEDLTYLSTLGYSFKGWYANGGEVKENGAPVLVTNDTKFTQPTELVAYWEKEIFTAVFLKGDNQSISFTDPSQGYVENFDGQTGVNGRVVTAYFQDNLAGAVSGAFPEEIPVKENYTFKGWYLADADRLPTSKVVDKTFKLEKPVVYIVPVFEENTKALTVSIKGSGSIYTLIDAGNGLYNERSISNRIDMPVTKNYNVRIRPSEGYALSAVTVNGTRTTGTDLAGVDGYYDITIESIISTDYLITAEFTLTEFNVSITNGTGVTNNGTITYGLLGTKDTQESKQENVITAVNYGSGLSIEINPDNGSDNSKKYYISSVSLNGINLEVPAESIYYNLVIENIIENQNVVITYREFRYRVTLPEESDEGSMVALAGTIEYARGDTPEFIIQAKEGYYIRRVTANGTIIDPYISAKGYTVLSLEVNGADYDGSSNDYRVTEMELMIGFEEGTTKHGIEKDVVFVVEYAKLYYNVTTSYEGIGTVASPFTATYGSSYQVKAETSSGYYVYSHIVNGVEYTYDDVQTAREFNIESINRDYDIKFVFKRTTYFVRFVDENGYASVTFGEQTINLVKGEGYTFSDIEHATTAYFDINTKEGYYINKIAISSNAGDSYDEVTNFQARSHVVTLSNVKASYTIEIDCLPINMDYKVYLINKATNEVSINSTIVSGNSYSSNVAFGGEINVNVTPDYGYVLELDNVTIKNKDLRDTYYYLPLESEYEEVESNGYYSILTSTDLLGNEVLTLFVYDVKTIVDIYIYFEEDDADASSNVLNYTTEGNGSLVATKKDGTAIASGSTLENNTEVKFELNPQVGNTLKALIINGQEVVVADRIYTLTVREDLDVCAVFDETHYIVTVQGDTPNGIIATDKSLIPAGTSFNLRLTPVDGYYVRDCSITVEGSSIIYQPFSGDTAPGVKDYEFKGENVTGNVTITAQFAPIKYSLVYTHTANGSLSGVGTTGDLEVYYGETKSIDINANDGYYISDIILNGESISVKTLLGTPIATGEYVSGKLQIDVSGDVSLDVVFSPMVYTITINESLGGTTLVKKDNSAYLPANEIKLGAGDDVSIKMQAEEGYHIASLEVPGREIDDWKQGNVSANDLNQIFYNLGTVNGNITVIVKYAINEYQIKVNATNASPNFSAIDVDSSTFGVITVNGSAPDDDKYYTHGSNVKFVVTPRTARGYYIAKFELQYIGDDGKLKSEIINSINENGGSYILRGISRNILAVNVEFKRRTYSYSQSLTIESEGAPWLSNGSLVATFKNPYSTAPVVLENGMYEYGLSYTISAIPGDGYKLLPEEKDENGNVILSSGGFKFNGESRLSSVRNNLYVGTVTSDMDFDVVYVIETYTVDMIASSGGSYAIYDIDNTLLWMPGITILDEAPEDWDIENQGYWTLKERQTLSGTIWATENGLKVTYGTELIFSATPDTSIGHRITTFRINNVNRTIQNEDALMRVTNVITKDTLCEILFTVHTYTIKVNTFTGGLAQLSTSTVEWNNSLTIKLLINRGYVMSSVTVNGEDKSAIAYALEEYGIYTEAHVHNDWDIVITLANKEYDITFSGDYATTYEVMQNGEVAKRISAVSGVIINENVIGKNMRSYYTNEADCFSDDGRLLNRAVFADKLTLVLTAPNGYRITSVFITMDNDGGVVSNLVLGESGLDADDGSGRRTFTIPSMTGNVVINVTYAIKQYTVEYLMASGGQYESTGITLVSHHELFTINLISNAGFYLSSLNINGRNIPTVYTKDGMRYQYTTTTKVSNVDKLLEIDDTLVNGENKITILPTYEKQKFNVIFFVNNQQITNLYQDDTLGLTLTNNELVYDEAIPSTIMHELRDGYSITNIAFYNMPKANQLATYYNFMLEGTADRNYNLFTPKAESLAVKLDEAIISMMDFHSSSRNVVRIYYTTAIDEYDANTSMYLVQGVTENGRAVNRGNAIESSAVPTVAGKKAFTLKATFDDNKDVVRHEYGTEATITVNIPSTSINSYSFQGFQEYKNGVWSYVTHDPENSGITLQSNGQVLRYTMTSTRTFRAVFFRVYEITVEVHPEYKYYEGSFANNDPSRMRYRQYASLTATATYSQNSDTGVIMPNIVGISETLNDTDGVNDASYTYRVLSGARLVLRGSDSINVNATRGYSYSVITYENGKKVQRDDGYNAGVETLEDRLVYAYFNNVMYVSFAMETVGSTVNSEGGTVTYAKDGAAVGSLSNNSLTMNPNQTLTITIVPKANYRFDSIMELLPLATPDAQGFRQYSNTYSPLSSTADGSIQITYYKPNMEVIEDLSEYDGRIGTVIVTINNLCENSIFKIRFWKQIEVRSSVSIITDEADENFRLGYEVKLNEDLSSKDGLYDYNSNLFYDIQFGLYEPIFSGFSRYYQFVGYFVNGINSYTQLVQNYPSTYEGSFVLNDLDNLSNGVNIIEKTTINAGVATTTFYVEIVARFIPVYNVVVENEYLDNGDYLNPGQITASAIMYDEALTQYFTSSSNVEPKLGQNVSYNTDMSFQMLGKINTIDTSNKNSADSKYNTWNDNTITLHWAGGEGASDSFSFIAWQYYAFNKETSTFEWRNIPYVDPNSQTNLVTKGTYTFPISCLFSTTYPAFVSNTGSLAEAGFYYNASVYDYNGNYTSFNTISAIRIRPLFQKVENLTLVKSTALHDETIFLDGQGDADPKINSTSRSNGYFNYYTVQTILPSSGSNYQFAGWYITENGNGGYQALDKQATAEDYDKVVEEDGTTYYLKTVEIQDVNGNGTGNYISYSYNPITQQANVLMDASFKIYARYIRVYNIDIMVSNVSGFAKVLTDAMPTLNYYKWVDGDWQLQAELSGNRMINITDARVGSKIKFTLSTNFSGDINDTTRFNPMFDRFSGITSVNENNVNVWDGGRAPDSTNSNVPSFAELNGYILGGTASDMSAYNSAITGMEIIITANDQKTINVNFESYGSLILHNVYVGSSIKLPNELGEILYNDNTDSVELASDASGNDAYFVKDGGKGDYYNGGIVDGIIAINNIPILASRSFDGKVSGDYATRLIDNSNVLDSDNISIGVNFDGSKITKKIQHVAYYGEASWEEYEYVDGTLTAVPYSAVSKYDYPFADGDSVSEAGDGSASKPFKVANVDHLRNIDNIYKGNNGTFIYGQEGSTTLRIHFEQVADINLNETNNALTAPLCSAFYGNNGTYHTNGFNGIYDGKNYSLYNLQLELRNSNITENVGIFSKIYRGGVVKNVALGRASISSNAVNVGAIAGNVFGGTIENVYYKEVGSQSISNGISGSNFVGGLVGVIAGESESEGVIRNSSIANFNISASVGGSYLGLGSDYTGGAGGIVGSIGNYGSVQGSNGGYTVKTLTISSGSTMGSNGMGAGGVAGTVQAYSNKAGHTAIKDVIVIDTRLSNENHKVAIGGIVGAVGANRIIENADYSVSSADMTIRSYSAPAGFTEPTSGADGNYLSYGGGGIAGYNNGTINNSDVTTAVGYTLSLTGSMVGGAVGVNLGTVYNSRVTAKMYTSRQMNNAYEGGTYGGIIGYNMGKLIASTITGSKSATDDYNQETAAYEVVTNGNSVYVPTAGKNGLMHGDAGADTATIYVGGVVGYNIGSVESVTNNAKIMVNRRSNDTMTNSSYVGAICGFSTNDNVSSSGSAIVKFFHYIWVDQATDVMNTMYTYVGNLKGNGIALNGATMGSLNATVEYIGGGIIYNPASIEAGFTWGFEGTGYLSGAANVYLYNANTASASSYAPDWNVSGTIEAGKGSGKIYAEDCKEVGGGIETLWKSTWNYEGALRYVAVTTVVKP